MSPAELKEELRLKILFINPNITNKDFDMFFKIVRNYMEYAVIDSSYRNALFDYEVKK